MQVQNSFTVSVMKFLLIPLGAWLTIRHEGGGLAAHVEYAVSLLLVLPYMVLAPTAGWMGDAFSKSRVIKSAATLQTVLVVLLCVALSMQSLFLGTLCFFLYAVQCCMLSPAKLGVVKDLVGSKHLAFATGVIEGTVILAILAGQILGGLWFDWQIRSGHHGWDAALHPAMWLVAVAALGTVAALLIHNTPAVPNAEKFTPALMWRHFRDSKVVWFDADLRFCALAVAFFWGFAGFVNLLVIEIAKHLHPDSVGIGTTISKMMAAVSMGIAAGSVFAGWISRKGINWSLVPLGLFALALGMALMAIVPPDGMLMLVMLVLTGVGAATFLVPVTTFLQDHPPAEKRGTVISVSNFFNNVGGILSVLLQFVLSRVLSFPQQFCFMAIVTAVIGVLALRRWLPEVLRAVILPVVRWIYRPQLQGVECMPEKGGVLLLPNHVTWIDTFFISAACERPVRFVMYEGFMDTPVVGWAARLFRTIPIAPQRAKDAMKAIVAALQQGDVVCVFTEGELTRTGCLQEIKRGVELMTRIAQCPAVVLWMQGLWGSVFSFERNCFFRKWPQRRDYGVTLLFKGPLAWSDLTVERVEATLRRANGEALQLQAQRMSAQKTKTGALPNSLVANALQVAQVNLLPWRGRLQLWQDDAELVSAAALWREAAAVQRMQVRSVSDPSVDVWVGGQATREWLRAQGQAVRGIFIDISAREPDPTLSAALVHCPCLMHQGLAVAVSMPQPPSGAETSPVQWGAKTGAVGRLLPGVECKQVDGRLLLSCAAWPEVELTLPVGARVDVEGFLFWPQAAEA